MDKRSISCVPLLFASISAILGSGWLFSAYLTSVIAGPGSIIAWLIGGGMLIVIAFVFAELSAMLPITGSSVRIPLYTHGTLVSFIFAWLIWLSYVSMVPTEVQAVIQYVSFYFPLLVYPNSALTGYGYLLALVLMLMISVINVYSVRWLIRANNGLTLIKIMIPLFICAVLFLHHHQHPANLLHGSWTPYGIAGIFSAIATGGIIFAFNGFKQACEMAGEAQNPSVALPVAIIGSIVFCLVLYLVLQVTFLATLSPGSFLKGWHHLYLLHPSSPFSSLLQQQHLPWLSSVLYVGAIVAPLAAGLMYMSSASRALYAHSVNGHLPQFLQVLNPQGNPIRAIVVCFLFGLMFFFPMPGWQQMVAFLTSIMGITYAIGPICLLTLRRHLPHQYRPFKLPMSRLWCYLAFYFCNLITYWSGWHVLSKLGECVLVGFIFLYVSHWSQRKKSTLQLNFKNSLWVWLYFIGMSCLSYYGTYGGGQGILSNMLSLVVIAVFSCVIMFIAIRLSLSAKQVESYVLKLKLPTRSDAL